MFTTYAGVTPSLPSCNPNASRMDERPVQLTRTDGHVDNPAREKIKSFRELMYNQSTFNFRAHMKTEVHRAVYRDALGQRMVTVEGISVCMRAWMHISRVPQASFYQYQGYARANREASEYGNTGLAKPRKHTQ